MDKVIRIRYDTTGIASGGALVTRNLNAMDKSAQNVRKSFGLINAALMTIGVGFGTQQIISTIGSLQNALAATQAVTKANSVEMQAMTAQARELGATTVYSATQAAEGMRFLGMAGFDTNKIIESMPAMLDLAAAASLDLGRSADITSNILTAFNLEASKSREVVDVLAVIASSANTDITQMGDAMKYVGPVAAASGRSIKDMAAAVGILGNAGIQGTMAGTSLRRIIAELINPGKATRQVLNELGLSLDDISLKSKTLGEVFATLEMAGANTADMFSMFDQRGGVAAEVLSQFSQQLITMENKVKNVNGEANRMSKTMMDTIPGSIKILESSIAELILQLGDAGLTKKIRDAIDSTSGLIQVISQTNNPLDENRKHYEMLAATLTTVIEIGTAAAALFATWKIGAVAGGIANAALTGGGFGAALGPIGALIGIISALGIAYYNYTTYTKDAEIETKQLITEFVKLTSQTSRTEEEQRKLNLSFEMIKQNLPDTTDTINDFTIGLIDAATAAKELNIAALVKNLGEQATVKQNELRKLKEEEDEYWNAISFNMERIKKIKSGESYFSLDNGHIKYMHGESYKGEINDLYDEIDDFEMKIQILKEKASVITEERKKLTQELKRTIDPIVDSSWTQNLSSAFLFSSGYGGGLFSSIGRIAKERDSQDEDMKKAINSRTDFFEEMNRIQREAENDTLALQKSGAERKIQELKNEEDAKRRQLADSYTDELVNAKAFNLDLLDLATEFGEADLAIIKLYAEKKKEVRDNERKLEEEEARRKIENIQRVADSYKSKFDLNFQYDKTMGDLSDLKKGGYISEDVYDKAAAQAQLERIELEKRMLMDSKNMWAGAKVAAWDYFDSVQDKAKESYATVSRLFSSLEDQLTNMFVTGKFDVESFFNTIQTEFYKTQIVRPILGGISGMFGGGSFGGDGMSSLFSGGVLSNFFGFGATGGVFNSPTIISEYGQREAAVPLPDGNSIPVKILNNPNVGNIIINMNNHSRVKGSSDNIGKNRITWTQRQQLRNVNNILSKY